VPPRHRSSTASRLILDDSTASSAPAPQPRHCDVALLRTITAIYRLRRCHCSPSLLAGEPPRTPSAPLLLRFAFLRPLLPPAGAIARQPPALTHAAVTHPASALPRPAQSRAGPRPGPRIPGLPRPTCAPPAGPVRLSPLGHKPPAGPFPHRPIFLFLDF